VDRENRDLNKKLNQYFPGRVVRKDLTQKNKRRGKCPHICP
jgi:ATP-dependent Lon protease